MAPAMHFTTRFLFALPLIAGTAACASSSQTYPSLDIRDFERESGTLGTADSGGADTPSIPAVPASDLAALETQAETAHAAFMAAVPTARRKVRAGAAAPFTSNAWGDAQIALSDLDAKRSLTAITLGDLDLLYAEQAVALNSAENVDAVRAKVTAMLRAEDVILAELRGGQRR